MKLNIGIFTAALLGGALVAQADNHGVSVGGYIDAQYNWMNAQNYGGATDVSKNVNTFRLSEGALYLGKKVGGAEVFVDLDIAGPAKTSSSGFVSGVEAATLTVGQTKSQAYVAMDYDNGFSWRFGQFDSLYGWEANDTHEVNFAEQGILWAAMPVTHVGLHAGYEFSDMLGLHFLVANPYDQGHMKNGNLDLGVKVKTNFQTFSFNLGALINTGDHSASGAEKESGFIIDTDISADFGAWDGAIFGYAKKEDVKGAEVDWGAGVEIGFGFSDHLNLGARIEYEMDGTDNAPAASSGTFDDSTFQATVGPQFLLAEGLVAKVDYSFKQISFDAGDSQTDHVGNVAAVFKF